MARSSRPSQRLQPDLLISQHSRRIDARRAKARHVAREGRDHQQQRRDSRKHPVLCGELPSEEDMAYLAYEDLWRPVLAALKDLDAKD